MNSSRDDPTIGRAVRVPGGITVVAVLIGAALLGVVGALVAIPVAAARQERTFCPTFAEVPRRRLLCITTTYLRKGSNMKPLSESPEDLSARTGEIGIVARR
ncbi:hypothetical protein ACKUVQ_18475 [Mycobacterium seoulense]|uniref:hypothetical protein n=1 Tax=Mycobacterium seoulense TaxID=386911 RepID=UPI003CF34719